MSLSDLEFAFFFPAVFALYWLLPRRAAVQNVVLLLASFVFYATWNLRLLPVLLIATGVDYAVGRYLGANPLEGRDLDEAAEARVRRRRKWALGVSIAFNLGLLGYFKYAGFFTQSLDDLLTAFGLPSALPVLRIALPLGISYYTLQKLGYVLDVYYERIEPCLDPLAFTTFTSFFPQLIAGPITRARLMLPQFQAARHLTPALVASGARTFLLGYAMKAYVADWLARACVDPVFADPARYTPLSLWIGLLSYAGQLFCDFGGYSIMAIGVGRLLGIELPQNFNYPYISSSLAEFWRRWHMSLNNWLFDYLFAPLTTGRSWFRSRMGAGFIVVFLVSGLWHGAMWTFVLWGLFHGLALAVHHRYDGFYKKLCRKDRRWVARRNALGYVLASWAVTQLFFVLTLVPFRAPSVDAMVDFAIGLFVPTGTVRLDLGQVNLVFCAVFLLAYHLLEVGRGPRVQAAFDRLPAPVRGVAYGLVIVFLFVFVPVGASTFIYAQF